MWDLFVNLPASLWCAVLGEWLGLADIARLDSSICNREKRRDFLSHLQRDELVAKDYAVPVSCHALLWNWIMQRKIKLSQISSNVYDGCKYELMEYVAKCAKHITHLSCVSNLDIFALYCTNLVHLSLDVTRSGVHISILLQSNPTLRSLTLYRLSDSHFSHFDNIRLPHLSKLNVRFFAYSRRCFEAILTMTTCLLELDMYNVCADTIGVAKLCPHIRSLRHCATLIQLPFDIAEFTSHCPHIDILGVVDFDFFGDQQFAGVVRNLRKLRSLSMKFDQVCFLTDEAIRLAALHCAATLESFSLHLNVHQVSHRALQSLRTQCTKLHTFNVIALWGTKNIPWKSVTVVYFNTPCSGAVLAMVVAAMCPALKTLRLRNTVPAAYLEAVSQSCPCFSSVELQACSRSDWLLWKDELRVLPHLRVVRC